MRALIHLALQPAGARLSQADIASAIAAPAPFVGKVMQQLAAAGLVTSQRGIGGGFALHPVAVEATMLDAVTAIEGPLALNTCLSPDEPCERAAFCPAHRVWHDAQARVVDVLRAATIGHLARQVDPRGAVASPMTGEASQGHRDGEGVTTDEPRDGGGRGLRACLRSVGAQPSRPRVRDVPGIRNRPAIQGPMRSMGRGPTAARHETAGLQPDGEGPHGPRRKRMGDR